MTSIEAGNLFSVKGMVIVITGGGSGIGKMMAHALDVNGASKVYILGRRQASLEKVASEAKNSSIIPIVCDATSKDSLAATASTIASQTPFINALIANAGIAGPPDALTLPTDPSISALQAHLWSTSSEDFNAVSSTNLGGPWFTFVAFLNLLAAGNTHPASPGHSGYIPSQFITTGSIAGESRVNMLGYPYGANKAALNHLTKMIATQFAEKGIRANAILPGFFRTEATEFMVKGAEDDLSVPGNMDKEVNPALRAGSEEDIAGVILYLVSRAGGFVNGAMLLTDGGGLSIRAASY